MFSTLWHGFRLPLVLGIAITVGLALLFRRLLRVADADLQLWPVNLHTLIWPLAVFIVFAGIRSTTQHRPANPAMFAITADAMVNSLVINSGYSVLYAIYSLKHEARSTEVYGKLPEDAMVAQTRDWPWLKSYQYTNPGISDIALAASASQPAKATEYSYCAARKLRGDFCGVTWRCTGHTAS